MFLLTSVHEQHYWRTCTTLSLKKTKNTFTRWCTFFIQTLLSAPQPTHFVTVCTYRQLQSERFSVFISAVKFFIPPAHTLSHSALCLHEYHEWNNIRYIQYFIHAGHIHIVTIHLATVGFKSFLSMITDLVQPQ